MAQKSQGIQQLLAAEKKAAELVGEARKRKTKRLKQAKEEAIQEIEQYKQECEAKFKEKQGNEQGALDFQKKINEDTVLRMGEMGEMVGMHKDQVILRILDLVYDIQPGLHENYRQ